MSPLCTNENSPKFKFAWRGCTLAFPDPPVVEYRTCPIAIFPGSFDIIFSSPNISPILPSSYSPVCK